MSTNEKNNHNSNIHAGHRERMRKRFLKDGINIFDDYQVLEFLMYYVYKRGDTNPIGHNLINEFKTLEAVFNAEYEELQSVEGIGPSGALLINFIGQLRNKIVYDSMNTHNIKFNTIADIGHYCMDCLRHLNHERLIMLSLNDNRELISRDIISEGVSNATSAEIKTIVSTALKRNASGIILAHNHPGGNSHPSSSDINTTSRIIDSLSGINVSVIDHIICGEFDFSSFYERELLNGSNILER